MPKNGLVEVYHLVLKEFCSRTLISSYLTSMETFYPAYHLFWGKVSGEMAEGVHEALGSLVRGWVISPDPPPAGPSSSLSWYRGNHPVPDSASFAAGSLLVARLQELRRGDHLDVWLSGGASSLACYPLSFWDPMDWKRAWEQLLRQPWDIGTMNCARAFLCGLKCGGLFRYLAEGVRVRTMIVSDVAPLDPAYVGSGPTSSYFKKELFEEVCFWLGGRFPRYQADLKARLQELSTSRKSSLRVLCDRYDLLAKLEEGFSPLGEVDRVQDGLSQPAEQVVEVIRQWIEMDGEQRGIILLMGGELVLEVPEGAKRGGRCQHLGLLLMKVLRGYENWELLLVASDGKDGGSGGSGCHYSDKEISRVDWQAWEEALERFDSYTFHGEMGTLLPEFASDTNLNEFLVLRTR